MSESVEFNVPLDTQQVISETSLSIAMNTQTRNKQQRIIHKTQKTRSLATVEIARDAGVEAYDNLSL